MAFNPKIHHRKSTGLHGYNYTQASCYFVTICTHHRQFLFGDIFARDMVLNASGKMVQTILHELPQHYPQVELDESVIMPNYMHTIIRLNPAVGARFIAPSPSVGDIVRSFKARCTHVINAFAANAWGVGLAA